jgi:dihydrofolate reductase
MKLAVIVAHDKNGCIGKDNKIPWDLSSDMKMFKETTMGKPVIMGRKTFESIGRPLPGRLNIVLTKNPQVSKTNQLVFVSTPEEALVEASNFYELKKLDADKEETFIIGGGEIYELFFKSYDIHHVYVTTVYTMIENGNAFFKGFYCGVNQNGYNLIPNNFNLDYNQYYEQDLKDQYAFSFKKYSKHSE